jgi:hypothetical protein
MNLEKHLARFAQKCDRVNADHWSLALTNGRSLAVSARLDEGFLLLDADSGVRVVVEPLTGRQCATGAAACSIGLATRSSFVTGAQLKPLTELSRGLPSAVKFALHRGAATIRLRAEFPLPEESDAAADRIHGHLDGMRIALHRLHESFSPRAAGGNLACPPSEVDGQANSGSLPELLKEAGWPYHERPAGALLADLETGSQFLQAEIDTFGAGVRFRMAVCRAEAPGEGVELALCCYLLECNAALRYARAFFERESEGISAGFEVLVEGEATAVEASHALAALSVAGRQCARELEVLKDAATAGMYRSGRAIFHHDSKGA